jgi:hypothetical protein
MNNETRPMKIRGKSAGLIILGLGLIAAGCAKKRFTSWEHVENPAIKTQFKSFVAEKEAQADSATNDPAPGFAPFFAAAKSGDCLAVRAAFSDFARHAPQYQHSGTNDSRLSGTIWQSVLEIDGAFEVLQNLGDKYFALYGNDVIQSIPPGSIYFGGDDNGRFVITAMQKSQMNGDPFFTLTQNALADGTYLDYLRATYGDKIYIPTPGELQDCYQEYRDDAKQRLASHQLKSGENIKIGPDGRVAVSGWRAVMTINGLLAKIVFDKNPRQDFYLQQSFPLDWTYPYLEPHGLIFKLDREPPPELSDDVVQADHDFWTNLVSSMIGKWLTDETTVKQIVAFAEKVYLKHDFSGFTGDRQFVENQYAGGAFSNNRLAIANLYLWRMRQATSADDKERMAQEADFAFRQALALCPANTWVTQAYKDFLRSQRREADAVRINRMARQLSNRR